jgi:hypothetical protein
MLSYDMDKPKLIEWNSLEFFITNVQPEIDYYKETRRIAAEQLLSWRSII